MDNDTVSRATAGIITMDIDTVLRATTGIISRATTDNIPIPDMRWFWWIRQSRIDTPFNT